VINNEN